MERNHDAMEQHTTLFRHGEKKHVLTYHQPDPSLEQQERDLVNLYSEVTYQTVLGFGGAFTDAAGAVFALMPKEKQRQLIHAYFSKEGLGYTLGRTSIDSCDFSLECYASDDVEGDTALRHFDPSRAQKYVLPMLKMAQEAAGKPIELMLTPWTPPAWMKTNGSRLQGGELKPEFYAVWAEYICRYIEAYQDSGAQVRMLSSQNEPKAIQTWDSCLVSAAQERMFIQAYLAPALKQHGLDNVQILIWDHNKERAFDRACDTLCNDEIRRLVRGVAVHWYSGDHFEALQMIHERFPELCLVFSEACIEFSRFGQDNQLHDAEMYAHEIIGDFTHGLNAFLDWNLLVNQHGGPNHVGNNCAAPMMYNTDTGVLHQNLSFDYLGHFSRYLQPGAVRIGTSRFTDRLEILAVQNPDGAIAAVVLNRSDADIAFCFRQGRAVWSTTQPAHSISTCLFEPGMAC